MSTIKDTLAELIEPYKYGKYDLLDRIDELTASRSHNTLSITNWFDYTPAISSGDCNELGIKAYAKIGELDSGIQRRVVWGYDGEIFTPHTSGHCFLIVYDEKGEELVVDPSLKYVGALAESSYAIICDEKKEYTDTKLQKGRVTLELEDPRESTFVALGENQIFYLGQNLNESDDVLSIFRYYCLPGDIPSQFKNNLHQLSLNSSNTQPVFDLARRLNEHFKRQL